MPNTPQERRSSDNTRWRNGAAYGLVALFTIAAVAVLLQQAVRAPELPDVSDLPRVQSVAAVPTEVSALKKLADRLNGLDTSEEEVLRAATYARTRYRKPATSPVTAPITPSPAPTNTNTSPANANTVVVNANTAPTNTNTVPTNTNTAPTSGSGTGTAPISGTLVASSASTHPFGMAVGTTMMGLSSTEMNNRLNDMVSMGVTWVRFDIDWSEVQQTSSASFSWTGPDTFVKAAIAHGLKPLAVVAYSPAWARASGCTAPRCAPADPAAFATFAGTAAARYAPMGVHAYEIWNEENVHVFWQSPSAVADYVALLKLAAPAVRKSDPSATVLLGGLAPAATGNGDVSPRDFLSQAYALGVGPSMDAVAFHPYSFPVLPSYKAEWNAWQQMSSTSVSLRSIMNGNGDGTKKIWITEVGAPTNGPGALATTADYNLANSPDHVSEDLQAAIGREALSLSLADPLIGGFFWHTYTDLGTSTVTTENFFGMYRYDGSKKPVYDALKTIFLAN